MLYLVFVVPYCYINAKLTYELFLWVPKGIKRFLMLLAVWLLPMVGAVIAYKRLELDWFTAEKDKKSNKKTGGQTMVSGALLEADSIFNPGQRHVIEARQEEQVELSESGQMHDKQQLNLNKLVEK